MNVLERIKSEYMLFEPENVPDSLDEAMALVEVYLDDMHDAEVNVNKSIRRNSVDKRITQLKNFIYGSFGYVEEDIEWFDADTDVLAKHGVLTIKFSNFFRSIQGVINHNNFVELSTLAQFVHKNYMENYEYLESLRDSIEYSTRGISYYGVGEDTQKEFADFFIEEFGNITANEQVKVKKAVL